MLVLGLLGIRDYGLGIGDWGLKNSPHATSLNEDIAGKSTNKKRQTPNYKHQTLNNKQ